MSSAARPEGAGATVPRASISPWFQPWRELGYGVLIMVLSGIAGLLFTRASHLYASITGMPWSLATTVHVMIATVAITEAVCIALVLGRAWWTSDGDLAAAVSAGPVTRWWLLGLVVAAELALLGYNLASVLSSPLCGLGLRTGATAGIVVAARTGTAWLALYLFALVVLAPVAEELLFRGWLWSALRRSWGPWPTALVTGGLFWLLHAAYRPKDFLLVLPIAIILTVVRQFTGSIRGTILLHALQDGGAAVLTLVLLHSC